MEDLDGPYLEIDDDPARWITGPTPGRPFEPWKVWARDTIVRNLSIPPGNRQELEYVDTVLDVVGTREVSALPYFFLRWTSIEGPPLVLYVGQAEREDEDGDVVEDWLRAEASDPVEPPVRDTLPARDGLTLERALVYGRTSRRTLSISARYVADTGHPKAVVLAHFAGTSPAEVLAGCEDVEEFLGSVHLHDENPWLDAR